MVDAVGNKCSPNLEGDLALCTRLATGVPLSVQATTVATVPDTEAVSSSSSSRSELPLAAVCVVTDSLFASGGESVAEYDTASTKADLITDSNQLSYQSGTLNQFNCIGTLQQ